MNIDFSEAEMGLLLQAIHTAEVAHRGQTRKDPARSPYIKHPIEVMWTLWEAGVRQSETLCAAVLHDTIEDTILTAERLRPTFGPDIVALVLEVTDNKQLPQAERKRRQVADAPRKSPAAAQIKLADKLCNLRDLYHTPPTSWSRERLVGYADWACAVMAGLRQHHEPLAREIEQMAAQIRARYMGGEG